MAQAADKSISQMLADAGFGHRRQEHSASTGKHAIFRLSDGETVASLTAGQAVEWLSAPVEA